jgi:hypothetical protein
MMSTMSGFSFNPKVNDKYIEVIHE